MKALLWRLAGVLTLAVASAALTFVLMQAAPGDFLSEARLHPQLSDDTLATLRERYRLDRSAAHQFLAWILAIPQGDWGRSLARDLPVFPLLMDRGFRTLGLALGAHVLSWVLALGLSFAALRKPKGWLDRGLSMLAALLLSVPDAILALLSILLLTRLLPGGSPPGAAALCALLLALTPALWQQCREALRRAASLPFVEAARTNDLPPRLIWKSYVLPAAAPSLLPLAGLSIGSLLSSSLLIECIAAYPGLGPLLLDAVLSRDPHVVAGCILLSTLFWAAGSFAMDAAHWALDPRMRDAAVAGAIQGERRA